MAKVDALGGRTGRYYTDSVASGAEDYYAGRGESAGHWVGTGSIALGLEGVASTDHFHAVLNGRDPRDRSILRAVRARPKGSSAKASSGLRPDVLGAEVGQRPVGGRDETVASRSRLALDVATADALHWLEREACVVRRGHGGVFEFAGDGFVGVAFRHRLSRARTRSCTRTSWSATWPRARTTAGRAARHAALPPFTDGRLRLPSGPSRPAAQRLGVRWIESSTPGVAEIDGVPKSSVK
jgi:hypothetical protein